MKRNWYLIFLLPSFIIIFVLFYIQIGLAFGFVSKNIGEGGLFFAVMFYALILLQVILLIPAYIFYRKEEDVNVKLQTRNIFLITLLFVISIFFILPVIERLFRSPLKNLIAASYYSDDQIIASYYATAIISSILALISIPLFIFLYKKRLSYYALLFLALFIFLGFSAYNSSVFGVEHSKSEKRYDDVRINHYRHNINLILNGTGKPEWCSYDVRSDDKANDYIYYRNLCQTIAALKFQDESLCELYGVLGRDESESLQQIELCKKLVQALTSDKLKPTLCEEDKLSGFNSFRNPNEWRTCNYYVNIYFKGKLE